MKVKTYSVNTFDAWLQTEGDDTTGSYVKYEDYAALAAECAALKSAIEFADPWLPTCDEELLHRIEIAKQTPATDAYLAGIKADAITASLDACSDYLETDCVIDRLDISYEEAEKRTSGAIEFHDAMVDFANQLREGADK